MQMTKLLYHMEKALHEILFDARFESAILKLEPLSLLVWTNRSGIYLDKILSMALKNS